MSVCVSVCLSQKSLFLYAKNLVVSPVSRHFPDSRDLVVSPVSRHFPFSKVSGNSETTKSLDIITFQGILLFILFLTLFCIQGILSFLLFLDTFGKGWKIRRSEGWKLGTFYRHFHIKSVLKQ